MEEEIPCYINIYSGSSVKQMAVRNSNITYNNNAICWNNLYKRNTTRGISVFTRKPASVKMYSNSISNQSAGNDVTKNCNRGSSETTRVTSFYNWLAGIIDSNGCFLISKKKYGSCEITLKFTEINALFKIKALFGGSVVTRSRVGTVRWRLYNKTGLVNLILALNGSLIHPKRIAQFNKLCLLYNTSIKINPNMETIFMNGWLSGFMEAEGAFTINRDSFQMAIYFIKKERFLLDIVKNRLKMGSVHFDKSSNNFVFSVRAQSELMLILNYFKKFVFQSKIKNAEFKSFSRILFYKSRKDHLKSSPYYDYFCKYVKNFNSRNLKVIWKEEDIVQVTNNIK